MSALLQVDRISKRFGGFAQFTVIHGRDDDQRVGLIDAIMRGLKIVQHVTKMRRQTGAPTVIASGTRSDA